MPDFYVQMDVIAGWFDKRYSMTHCYRVTGEATQEAAAETLYGAMAQQLVDAYLPVWPESVQNEGIRIRRVEDRNDVLFEDLASLGVGLSPESHLPHEVAAVLLRRQFFSAPYYQGRVFVGPLGLDCLTHSGYWWFPDGTDAVENIWTPLAEAMMETGTGTIRLVNYHRVAEVGIDIEVIALRKRFGRQRFRRRGGVDDVRLHPPPSP